MSCTFSPLAKKYHSLLHVLNFFCSEKLRRISQLAYRLDRGLLHVEYTSADRSDTAISDLVSSPTLSLPLFGIPPSRPPKRCTARRGYPTPRPTWAYCTCGERANSTLYITLYSQFVDYRFVDSRFVYTLNTKTPYSHLTKSQN